MWNPNHKNKWIFLKQIKTKRMTKSCWNFIGEKIIYIYVYLIDLCVKQDKFFWDNSWKEVVKLLRERDRALIRLKHLSVENLGVKSNCYIYSISFYWVFLIAQILYITSWKRDTFYLSRKKIKSSWESSENNCILKVYEENKNNYIYWKII